MLDLNGKAEGTDAAGGILRARVPWSEARLEISRLIDHCEAFRRKFAVLLFAAYGFLFLAPLILLHLISVAYALFAGDFAGHPGMAFEMEVIALVEAVVVLVVAVLCLGVALLLREKRAAR